MKANSTNHAARKPDAGDGGGCDPYGADMIILIEQLLLERAMSGFRPVLYVSSPTDLQCAIIMLLPVRNGPPRPAFGSELFQTPARRQGR